MSLENGGGMLSGTEADQRLDRGEVVYYPSCPFPMPSDDDRAFLATQQQGGTVHKNISYDPIADRVHGCKQTATEHADRLRQVLGSFATSVRKWLELQLPR